MSIRHSLIRSATKNFVPGRYFFVRYRVSTSGNEIYRIFVPWFPEEFPELLREPYDGTIWRDHMAGPYGGTIWRDQDFLQELGAQDGRRLCAPSSTPPHAAHLVLRSCGSRHPPCAALLRPAPPVTCCASCAPRCLPPHAASRPALPPAPRCLPPRAASRPVLPLAPRCFPPRAASELPRAASRPALPPTPRCLPPRAASRPMLLSCAPRRSPCAVPSCA
eukprot:SAG11_NODE_157_length_14147_cov_8.545202_24_plen_219_part_01